MVTFKLFGHVCVEDDLIYISILQDSLATFF